MRDVFTRPTTLNPASMLRQIHAEAGDVDRLFNEGHGPRTQAEYEHLLGQCQEVTAASIGLTAAVKDAWERRQRS